MRQRDDQPFAAFLPTLERTMAQANATGWPDSAKVSTLMNTLNDRLREALVPVALPAGYNDRKTEILRVSANLESLKGRGVKWPSDRHSSPAVEDSMDWEQSTANSSRDRSSRPRNDNGGAKLDDGHLVGKRAKWVSQEELAKRRKEGRCLRCGRTSCRINRCPLSPAVNPNRKNGQQARVNAGGTKPVEEACVDEAEESEESKE